MGVRTMLQNLKPEIRRLCWCVVLLGGLPHGVFADDHLDQDGARRAVEAGQALPYAEVQARLRQACDCQILEARLHPENEHGRRFLVYEIKAISSAGQLFKLEMDAASGEVLHMKSKGKVK
jgi:uncharacterized membrane protein YkoI